MFDTSFLQMLGATSTSNRGAPSSPQPAEAEEARLGLGRGARALETLVGEREALAQRQSLGHRGAWGGPGSYKETEGKCLLM